MSITDMIQTFICEEGWTEKTLLILLMDYLEKKKDHQEVKNYLLKRAGRRHEDSKNWVITVGGNFHRDENGKVCRFASKMHAQYFAERNNPMRNLASFQFAIREENKA